MTYSVPFRFSYPDTLLMREGKRRSIFKCAEGQELHDLVKIYAFYMSLVKFQRYCGISNAVIAGLVGVTKSTVSKYETGYMVISIRTLMVILDFYGFTFNDFDTFVKTVNVSKDGYNEFEFPIKDQQRLIQIARRVKAKVEADSIRHSQRITIQQS